MVVEQVRPFSLPPRPRMYLLPRGRRRLAACVTKSGVAPDASAIARHLPAGMAMRWPDYDARVPGPTANPAIRLRTLVQQGPRAGARNYALPEIQREFCWSVRQVRSLAASVLAGYPIGSILLVESILSPTKGRVAYRTLDRRSKSNPGVPYVLDGQQRMLALLGAFRPPARGSVKESDWLSEQFALRGLWFIDLDEWLAALALAAGDAPTQDEVTALVGDPEVIGAATHREASLGVTVSDSEELMKSGTRLPLWMLVNASPRSRALAERDEDNRVRLRKKYEHAPMLVQSALAQLGLVKHFGVSVTRIPECSASRAASIFRRLNRQGTALSGPDLVCSQLSTFDLALRQRMRQLIESCGSRDAPFRRAFRGMFEEDLLLAVLCIRQKRVGGKWPDGVDAQLRLVSEAEGVASIREGLESLLGSGDGDPVDAAGEVLEACGVSSRYRWPEASVCLAMLSAIAVHPTSIGSLEWGTRKRELARWWWARCLRSAATGQAPSLPALFAELDDLMASGQWDRVTMPRSFAECGPAINLAAPRRGAALPGRSLARLVECMLRRRFQHDFVRGPMDRFASELDLHHVFPKKWVADRALGEADVLANLVLLCAKTNRKLIGARGPREFFAKHTGGGNVRAENHFKSILREQGVDADAYLGERFDDFISLRCQWFDSQLAMIADGIV